MATYNGEAYLREQLDSLAAQTVLPIELQIGDDGSTDRTEAIVRDFAATAPFPVVFRRNERNLGYGENFLQTAARCSGDWIAFSDQDDVWLPERLAVYSDAIRSGPADLRLVVSDAWLGSEEGEATNRTLYHWTPGTYARRTLPTNFYCHGFMQMFDRTLISDIPFDVRVEGPNNPDPLPPNFSKEPHEAWICVLANATGSICILPGATAIHRRHFSTVTFRPDVEEPTARMGTKERLSYDYRRIARWNAHAAARLAVVAGAVAEPLRTEIRAFAQRCDEQGAYLDDRSTLYAERSIPVRVSHFVRMLRSGTYRSDGALNLQSIAKDAIHLFVRSGKSR